MKKIVSLLLVVLASSSFASGQVIKGVNVYLNTKKILKGTSTTVDVYLKAADNSIIASKRNVTCYFSKDTFSFSLDLSGNAMNFSSFVGDVVEIRWHPGVMADETDIASWQMEPEVLITPDNGLTKQFAFSQVDLSKVKTAVFMTIK
jgi:hypothetical protein